MDRHRQRDEEAGGEGMGVVETRKRLWEDEDGNVVKKRPLTTPVPRARKRARRNHAPKTSIQSQEVPSDLAPSGQYQLPSPAPSMSTTVPIASDILDVDGMSVFDEWELPSPTDYSNGFFDIDQTFNVGACLMQSSTNYASGNAGLGLTFDKIDPMTQMYEAGNDPDLMVTPLLDGESPQVDLYNRQSKRLQPAMTPCSRMNTSPEPIPILDELDIQQIYNIISDASVRNSGNLVTSSNMPSVNAVLSAIQQLFLLQIQQHHSSYSAGHG